MCLVFSICCGTFFYRVKKNIFFTGKIFLNKSLVFLFSANMVFVAVKDYAFAGCRREK